MGPKPGIQVASLDIRIYGSSRRNLYKIEQFRQSTYKNIFTKNIRHNLYNSYCNKVVEIIFKKSSLFAGYFLERRAQYLPFRPADHFMGP